jgi:3-isopropylmalate dehydratase small subunit
VRAPFVRFRGVAAPLPLSNVNTDAIIPSAYLRSQTSDLARGLFGRWRFDEADNERGEFVLNRAPYRNAEVLLAGENFGCGSSREAAVWALLRFGIRCIAAPTFADIFYENAFRNGLLAAIVDPGELAALVRRIDADPDGAEVEVDLERQTMTHGSGTQLRFEVPAFRRQALLDGDDEIGATLRHADDIARYVAASRARHPWLWRAIAHEVAR